MIAKVVCGNMRKTEVSATGGIQSHSLIASGLNTHGGLGDTMTQRDFWDECRVIPSNICGYYVVHHGALVQAFSDKTDAEAFIKNKGKRI